MAMDQYLLISFLGEWTSINPSYFDVNKKGVQGFDTLPYYLTIKSIGLFEQTSNIQGAQLCTGTDEADGLTLLQLEGYSVWVLRLDGPSHGVSMDFIWMK